MFFEGVDHLLICSLLTFYAELDHLFECGQTQLHQDDGWLRKDAQVTS